MWNSKMIRTSRPCTLDTYVFIGLIEPHVDDIKLSEQGGGNLDEE